MVIYKTYNLKVYKFYLLDPAKFVRIIEGTAESGKVLTFFNEPAVETGDSVSFKTYKKIQNTTNYSKYTLCDLLIKSP